MGVLHLWEILEKAKSDIKVDDLMGKSFAVDLATWICESEGVKPLKGIHARPYLRNLFFRVNILLRANINLVFVLDGKPPELKLDTIARRLAASTGGEIPKKPSTGIRSRLNMKLNQCCKLLDTLGIPWIKAEGEAESLCAELNKAGLVDGVITNDGDAFLYGANMVIRNLSLEKNCTIEMYTMKAVKEILGFSRNDLIAFGLLLGCDYCPGGVAGVGVAHATKLLSSFKDVDSLEVFNIWRKYDRCYNASCTLRKSVHCSTCGHEGTKNDHMLVGCLSCENSCAQTISSGKHNMPTVSCICAWHSNEQKRKIYALEEKVKAAVLQDPSFSDQKIIEEFTKQQRYFDLAKRVNIHPLDDFETLKSKFQRQCPALAKASRCLNSMLEWDISYAFTKVLPLVTNFVLTHPMCKDSQIQLNSIQKKRVRDFVPSLDVNWKLLNEDLLEDLPDSIDMTTTESLAAMTAAFPDKVIAFHEHLQREKEEKINMKSEMRKAARKSKAKKAEQASSNARITDYYKVKKGRGCHSVVTSTKRSQELEKSPIEGSLKLLDTQFKSLSLLSKASNYHTKTSVDHTADNGQIEYQQNALRKAIVDDSHLKKSDGCATILAKSKPKITGRKILFSSDSESDADGADGLVIKFAKSQPKETEYHIKQTLDVTDTTTTVNYSSDITFSQDINFSFGSSFMNGLNCNLPPSPSQMVKQANTTSGRPILKESNCLNAVNGHSDALHLLSSPPNKSHERSISDAESPVFMTLMERLNARKNAKS